MQWSLATVALIPRGAIAHADASEQLRVVTWARQAGFRGIEVSPQWLNIDDAAPSELKRFRLTVEKAGLVVSGINVNRCLFTRGPQAEESLARMHRAIDLAEYLGTKLVTFSLSQPLGGQRPPLRGSDVPVEEYGRAAATLTEVAVKAAEAGIEISLELHDDGLLDTPERCLEVLQQVDSGNVGVNPDLGNFVRSTSPSADWKTALRMLAPRANNWHVKNYRGIEPVALWDGDIDYDQAFSIMRSANYDGWVSIESYFGDAFDLQQRSLLYLQRLAERGEKDAIIEESAA